MIHCHCLCIMNHPEQESICLGSATQEIMFRSHVTGQIAVAMCEPCFLATLKHIEKGGQDANGK